MNIKCNLSYIRFSEASVVSTKEVAEDVLLDFDKQSNLVGIEIIGPHTITTNAETENGQSI